SETLSTKLETMPTMVAARAHYSLLIPPEGPLSDYGRITLALSRADSRSDAGAKAVGVGSSARLCQKSIFRKCGLTKSMACKARMLQKLGFDTVWCEVR